LTVAEMLLDQAAELEREAVEVSLLAPSAFFTPNPAQYRYLDLCQKVMTAPGAQDRVNVMLQLGGNDTGKTRILAEVITAHLLGPQSEWFDRPPWSTFKLPCRVRGISTQKALEEGLIRELRAALGPHLAPGYPRQAGHQYPAEWVLTNGSRLDLYTWDQAVTQHAGAFIDVLVCDEPGKRQVFNEAAARLRRGGPVYWCMTPVDDTGLSAELSWVFDEVTRSDEGAGNGWHICYSDAEDNCELHGVEVVTINGVKRELRGRVPHAVIEDRRKRWEGDPATMQARFFGRMVRELGRVLKEWNVSRHVFDKIQVHPSWPRYAAIDVHPSKPQYFIYGALDNFGCFHVLKEIVSTELIPVVAQQIREVYLAYGFPRMTIIDPLAATPNPLTGASIMDEYRKHLQGGNVVSAGKEKTDKSLGIARLRERLAGVDGVPLLKVHESCKMTISQANRWMIDPRTMAPAKEHDDAWECLYRIELNLPQYQTQQQSDLEQRLRDNYRSSLVV
jgi:hypothetical protein